MQRISVTYLVVLLVYALGSFATVPKAFAQIQISLFPLQDAARGDTVTVDVQMIVPEDIVLSDPIQAYQFEVAVQDSALVFLGIQTDKTLAGQPGWTSGANPENGRVGGFSSRDKGFVESGVLVRLSFGVRSDPGTGIFSLDQFRLNGGTPKHIPEIPRGMIPAKTRE